MLSSVAGSNPNSFAIAVNYKVAGDENTLVAETGLDIWTVVISRFATVVEAAEGI